MKKGEKFSVPVQKGPIVENPKSMKTMTHTERLVERGEELQKTKWGQHTDLHIPKK